MIFLFFIFLHFSVASSLPLPSEKPKLRVHSFYEDKLELFSLAPKTVGAGAIDPILNNNSTVTQELSKLVNTHSDYVAAYTASISFGTRIGGLQQAFELLMDTGSSWTWVEACNSDVYGRWKTTTCPDYLFDEDISPSYASTPESKTIVYGSGTTKGTISHEYLGVEDTANDVKM